MQGPLVTVQNPGEAVDQYGNTVDDWDAPVETSVALLAPPAPRREARLDETTDRRQGALYGYTLFMPAGTTVDAMSRVVVWGETFHVDGEPGIWTSGTGSDLGGIEVDVIRAA
jgi:hypothetical protein